MRWVLLKFEYMLYVLCLLRLKTYIWFRMCLSLEKNWQADPTRFPELFSSVPV